MRAFLIVAMSVPLSLVVEGQTPSPTSTSCTAARNLAVVKAWSSDTINVKENVSRQECHFTINGSPGQGAAPPAGHARVLREDQWTLDGPLPVPELAGMLDGASPAPAPGLTAALETYGSQIRGCFAARARRTSFRFDSDRVACAVSLDGFQGPIKVGASAGIQFTTAAPHLRLGVSAEATAHYLLVPLLPPR